MNKRGGQDSEDVNLTINERYSDLTLKDHLAFVFYCTLLCVPAYAIVSSAIKQDWLMLVVDLIFIPVAFVHGLLIFLNLL